MTGPNGIRTGVVAGAALPHAPQFFTLPPTEDADQVARVEAVMARIGAELRQIDADVLVVIANDHLENFVLHSVPSFTIHLGPTARGSFAGRDFDHPVPETESLAVLRGLQDEGFDPAFTYTAGIGYEFGIPLAFAGYPARVPILPIYVNTYAAPQPSPDRCYAFGQALHRAFQRLGLRAVVIASGGMSHYPGTEKYSSPDLPGDERLLAGLRTGNLRVLLTRDAAGLDHDGNVELRSWLILAGALGERVPNHVDVEPSWHHVYGILGWTKETEDEGSASAELHYGPFRVDRLPLLEALYALRGDGAARARFLADSSGYADSFDLDPDEREALQQLDERRLRELGVHPLLSFLARLQVDLERSRVR
jgi:2,3-dihydroxyphenylpropionate 1,2-dioxygenase